MQTITTASQHSQNYYHLGSTLRATKPQQTLTRIQPLLAKLGITRVANITGLDNIGIPVAIAIRPNSQHLSVAQGKGTTLTLAKISAIMESIESYHLENPPPPELQATYKQIQKHQQAISPRHFAHNPIQPENCETIKLAWAIGTNLINHTPLAVPYSLTCLNTTKPHADFTWLAISSNGIASGNTKTEATLHALYELIERDTLASWRQLPVSYYPQIDINSIDTPHCQTMIANIHAADCHISIWELNTKIKIPAFYAVITDKTKQTGFYAGSGAHLDKSIALARAITEAAQTRLTLISGSRDDIFPIHYQHSNTNHELAKSSSSKNYNHCNPTQTQHSFEADLNYLIMHLQKHSKNIICIDHTKPELDIPVIQMIIPEFNCDE